MRNKKGSHSDSKLKSLHGKDYAYNFELKQNRKRIDRILNLINLQTTEHVLDVGCGSALMLPFIHDKVNSYTGIDFSESFIDISQKKANLLNIGNAKFYCTDIVEFSNNHSDHYDKAFALDLSEHVYDREWLNILSAIKKCLKPNGVLYLHTPNLEFIIELLKENNVLLKQFPEHIAVRSMTDNLNLIRLAGFEIEYTAYIPHYNILKLLHPFSIFPFIGKYFKARIFIKAIKK